MPEAAPALAASDIVLRYGGVLALDGVSVRIERGSFAAILGPNGAGKSTLALVLSGMLRPTRGTITCGGDIPKTRRAMIRHGVCLVPEARRLFGQLSAEENLLLGGYGSRCPRAELNRRMAAVFEILPSAIRDDRKRAAATFSGGEQQMLAIGRALMADPKILIIDEPSLGLAPILIERVYSLLAELNRQGVTMVLIEQIATQAVRHADLMVLLSRGRVAYSGAPTGSEAEASLHAVYVGGGASTAAARG